VPRWEAESLGLALTEEWHCERCAERSPSQYRQPGDTALRDTAVGHLKATGHAVTYNRGSTELITPLATEPTGNEGER